MDVSELTSFEIEEYIACLSELQLAEPNIFDRVGIALDAGKVALMKHIPQKVELKTCVDITRKCIVCPDCNNFFGYQYDLSGRPKPEYCDECGQRLDWYVDFPTYWI